MRFFVIASLLVHIVIIANTNLRFKIIPEMQLKATVMSVQLVKQALLPIVGVKQKADKLVSIKAIEVTKTETVIKSFNNQPVDTVVVIKKEILLPLPPAFDAEVDNQAEADLQAVTVNFDEYLSTDEIDRKAMPQASISESDIVSKFSSGLPIKLRLYINLLGQLVKIERINVFDQDDFFASQLEQQLYNIVFLPARRNGVDVDSYQEIEFTFNSAPLILN